MNTNQSIVAKYSYTAWGDVLAVTYNNGSAITGKTHIGNLNPIRYRGYYYDTETGFYYLQSRYYDPMMRRFINADSYQSTGQGIVGTNMFAYCNNCPVIFADETGHMAGIKNWAIAMTDGARNDHYSKMQNRVIITGAAKTKIKHTTYQYSYSITLVNEIHTSDVEYVVLDDVVTFRNYDDQIYLATEDSAVVYGHSTPIINGRAILYAYAQHAGYRTRLKFEIEVSVVKKEYHVNVDSAKGLYSGISTAWDGLGSCGGINFMGSFGPCLQQPK